MQVIETSRNNNSVTTSCGLVELELDVGCGKRRLGDVNVDINREVRPDVVCDIHYLPFKDAQFEVVYCFHVLEHKGVRPEKAIRELRRVSKKIVEIQVPHWLSPNAKKDKTHVNFQVMRRNFWLRYNPLLIRLDYTNLLRLPFLLRPNNITIRLKGDSKPSADML